MKRTPTLKTEYAKLVTTIQSTDEVMVMIQTKAVQSQ